MQLAINEMDIYEELTPRFFESKMDLINRASLCIMDTNLPEESLRFLAGKLPLPALRRHRLHRQGEKAGRALLQDPHDQAQPP